jgi:3-phosphoshikimate 1-carboxyvinyltransferase
MSAGHCSMATKTSKTIHPSTHLAGRVVVPGDKSISHRAVILGALSTESARVYNFLTGEDCLRTVDAFRSMGIPIEQDKNELVIFGGGLEGLRAPKKPIDCGNSGTTTRLLMGVLTGQPFEVALEGDTSLSQRPMDRVMEPLSKMGAHFIPGKNAGRLPLKIHGTHSVRSIKWKSPVASAQVKSAILLSGLYASGVTEVHEPSLSRDHTERMLRASGVEVLQHGYAVSVRGTATVKASEFHVPGDLSSAAFLLAAGVLASAEGVTVEAIGVNPTRTGFLDLLKAMGGSCVRLNEKESGGEPIADVQVKKSPLQAVTICGDVIPRAIDEIPILAVLATQATGKTEISDAKELRVKESDRLATLCQELKRMGARIQEKPDGLIIEGPTALKGAVVNSHGDHRLAMSLAIAGLIAQGPTTIQDIACVDTSFPTFWDLLETLGGR